MRKKCWEFIPISRKMCNECEQVGCRVRGKQNATEDYLIRFQIEPSAAMLSHIIQPCTSECASFYIVARYR